MKNIIVSGANQGIGYYMVQRLLRDGYNVTILDLEIDNLKELPGNILPLVCNVGDAGQVDACVKVSVAKFGTVDCAVQNACMCTFDSFASTHDETYQKVFEVNYFGAIHFQELCFPICRRRKTAGSSSQAPGSALWALSISAPTLPPREPLRPSQNA